MDSADSEAPIVERLSDGGIAAIERSPDGKLLYVHDLVFGRYDCPPDLRSYVPVPDPHFPYDRTAMQVMYDVATAEKLKVPWLFDGLPGTSKTSSIQQFYGLLNRPVLRLNCRGHTDTTELIGKFLPSESHLQQEFSKLLFRCRDDGFLRSIPRAAQELFQEVRGGKTLSIEKTRRFAELCGIDADGAEWRWHDGAVPFCMKSGLVLLLDEADLARQEVLQGSTNSVLEENSTLTIPEHNGETIRRRRPGEDEGDTSPIHPLHEQFRIFATRNPMDESRIPFGLPYKDRWVGRTVAGTPTQDDYEQRLHRRVYGEQPAVNFRGRRYSAHRTGLPPRKEYGHPAHVTASGNAQLDAIPNFGVFLQTLAEFHTQVSEAAMHREIGKTGLDVQEGLVFTQRSLGALVAFLEQRIAFDRWQSRVFSTSDDPAVSIQTGLDLFYLHRCAEPEDRVKIVDMLTALGISLENWQMQFIEGHRYVHERDPKRFLRDCDTYLNTNHIGTRDRNWDNWSTASSADGKWVDMNMPNARDELPARFFDLHGTGERTQTGFRLNTESEQVSYEPSKQCRTMDELLTSIGGKPVRSILFEIENRRHWFLECMRGATA